MTRSQSSTLVGRQLWPKMMRIRTRRSRTQRLRPRERLDRKVTKINSYPKVVILAMLRGCALSSRRISKDSSEGQVRGKERKGKGRMDQGTRQQTGSPCQRDHVGIASTREVVQRDPNVHTAISKRILIMPKESPKEEISRRSPMVFEHRGEDHKFLTKRKIVSSG